MFMMHPPPPHLSSVLIVWEKHVTLDDCNCVLYINRHAINTLIIIYTANRRGGLIVCVCVLFSLDDVVPEG